VPGFVYECADEAGADAVTLVIGADFDASQVDLGGAVFDVENAKGRQLAAYYDHADLRSRLAVVSGREVEGTRNR
jgi:hypothetical protein